MDPIHQPDQQGYLPLYQMIRGGIPESVHNGAVAVVDSSGNLVAWYGSPQARTFLRSSAKPFQALPLLEMGGMEQYSLTGEELAVACASHSGTDLHLRIIIGMQQKIGISESDLLCCTHQPFDPGARARLRDQGLRPSQNHHNCSGKHTGMLALAKLLGQEIENYTEVDHPVQRLILSSLSEICGIEPGQIILGRDGCSVPTFAMPLYHAAWGWARLMDPDQLPEPRQKACRQITAAMGAFPGLVAGPGRFDTRVMEAGAGKLISKAGAEAFQAVGVYKNALSPGSPALGIGIKIADGDQGGRAQRAVTLEVLRQLKLLTADQIDGLEDMGPVVPIINQCGILAGEGAPCFTLQYGHP